MEKQISYKEKDLKSTLKFMSSSLETIEFYLRLLEEQNEGKRTNVSVGTFENIIEPASNLRRMIANFNVDIS